MKKYTNLFITLFFTIVFFQSKAQNQPYWKEGFEPNTTPACNLTTVNPTTNTGSYFNGNAGVWYGFNVYRTGMVVGSTGNCPTSTANSHLRSSILAGSTDSPFIVTPIVDKGIKEFHFIRGRASRPYSIWVTNDTNALTTNWSFVYKMNPWVNVNCVDTTILINSPFAKRLKLVFRPAINSDIDSIWLTSYDKLYKGTLMGKVYEDANSNGIQDANERNIQTLVQSISSNNIPRGAITWYDGMFNFDVPIGTYTTSISPIIKPYYLINPLVKVSMLDTLNTTDTFNFALTPVPNKNDLKVGIYTPSLARLNRKMDYYIGYVNVGTTTQNATITCIIDKKLDSIKAFPQPTSIHGDTLFWNMQYIIPDSMGYIKINCKVKIPPTAKTGDTLKNYVSFLSNVIDETPNNNYHYCNNRIIGSYDPNDKQEAHNGSLTPLQASSKEELLYTIRFQNTGNDTAFDVKITDELDSKFDINSFDFVSSSHPCKVGNDGNKLTFSFDNILLPDSNVNEPLSHGYIVYRIKPKLALTVGDSFTNKALIYFDLNDAVITNNHITKIATNVLPLVESKLTSSKMLNKQVALNFKINNNIGVEYLFEKSIDGVNFKSIKSFKKITNNSIVINDDAYNNNKVFYRVRIITQQGESYFSNISYLNFDNTFIASVFPNPTRGQITIQSNENLINQKLKIYDVVGKMVDQKIINNTYQTFDISTLQNGVYILAIDNCIERFKIIKQ